MNNSRAQPSEAVETKNVLPDVVHSQQIPTIVAIDENIDTGQNDQEMFPTHNEESKTESISEHIPSNCEYSTNSDNAQKLRADIDSDKVLLQSHTTIAIPHSPAGEIAQDPSKLSTSWPLDVNVDTQYISEESPVNLPLSSENPTETSNKGSLGSTPSGQNDKPSAEDSSLQQNVNPSVRRDSIIDVDHSLQSEQVISQVDNSSLQEDNQSLHDDDPSIPNTNASLHSHSPSQQINNSFIQSDNQQSDKLSLQSGNLSLPSDNATTPSDNQSSQTENEAVQSGTESQQSDNLSPRNSRFLDSLNNDSDNVALMDSNEKSEISDKHLDEAEKLSSGSEEIIKLDIRGKGTPKFPFPAAKIIFGPPPEGTVIEQCIQPIQAFPNLLSPFLVGAGDHIKVQEVFDNEPMREPSPDKFLDVTPDKSLSDKIEQSDLLIEEITVEDDLKEKEERKTDSVPPKSIPVEEVSYSTLSTDYKTICEEFNAKLVHLEDAIIQRDQLIEELTISLQHSVQERDSLRNENDHLITEVHNLQHVIAETPVSEHDTVKAQLSDLIKYHSFIKDDSTKFYSAVMSSGSSLQSSNSEKDNVREEITVNYSKSDLKTSESSDDFPTGIENKIATIISKFDQCIEENLRNKLRESLIQVLCDEIGKMRIEFDTDVKEMEMQLQTDKQEYTKETRKLRELLASVKAGSADIETLREELSVKHEKEMENLRTYFEKKCSDMERSYSEEVWRGRCASPLGSASSLEAVADAAGDYCRRRARSAELPSLSLESTPLEQALKQISRKYEQQIDELRAEHVGYVNELQARQREAVASLEEQLSQLKAHIQTTENTEANVALYQQDIDLELEKKMEAQLDQRLEEVREETRREVIDQLQEQLQVLLSDPDAEVSSWPLELVALRDRIQGDVKHQDREVSSVREELTCEEKWKQRRNHCFDQNRHLEELTKERDDLKRVAVSLHRVVGQLVAYCACAEDELNRTVLTHLLARILPADADETFEEARSSTPTANQSAELNSSVVSRGKHVHFAPDLNAILADLDEECIVGFLQKQRDLSADIKRELEHSLRRLRHEAHSLLDLSSKLADKSHGDKMLEAGHPQVTELVQDLDTKESCDSCRLHRKNMEEAMAECLQRESLLRADLDAAMMKIAQLLTSADVIAEGYGTGSELQAGAGAARAGRARACAETLSLDGTASPRAHLARLTRDLDLLQRDRDDLQQQLEAANRQLRSTRQFVEEQAAEREAERDEFARRLHDLQEENARLGLRLQNNARILNEMHCLRLSYCNCREHDAHVEQLETQTREMNQIITELETRKAQTDDELKATEEKVTLLRDIIGNLENQLEQKTVHEKDTLEQLEEMKKTIEDRDSKMRGLLGELESLRSERVDQTDVSCLKCGQEENKCEEMAEKFREQCRWLEEAVHRRTRRLERMHEVCSASCSEPSEDVSLRDHRDPHLETKSPVGVPDYLSEALGVWECLQAHSRAEDALLKRVADLEMQRSQLKDIAQEVRAERDVLQARMSEQALRISSLSARLQQQRNDAEAMSHQATSHLTVELHDARAEVQRMKEELESKDKQLARMKQKMEEKDKLNEQHSVYGNSCNPKDKVIILERELSSAQSRIAQLESLARSLESDKEDLQNELRNLHRELAEKDEQLHELLALKLESDRKEDNDPNEAKISARTLSDIISISEFDEQDLQMRRVEPKAQNASLTDAPYASESRDKLNNKTIPPDHQKPDMSSLNIDFVDHFELPSFTPRADSLPAHLTSTQNKVLHNNYKRNVNEMTLFGTAEKIVDNPKNKTAQIIQDNCSMYPNRDVSESKDINVEPKKINFSLEQTTDNKDEEEYTSLRELGITLDIRQENFPDILTQLKHEIKKSRAELNNCKSELKNAEEQLCEFPALKEEVEELKTLLENTMATMQNDKKFYENQLENFSSNKKLLEQRMAELTQEVNDKSKDLHLLKEDILRRENMILELAKEKRNLTNKLTELEVKLDQLQSRNDVLEKCEIDNHQLREKNLALKKLEHLVSEKNQQIDSLNQHLDRLDDLQRCLNDKTEEYDNLKDAFEEKCSKLSQLQETIKSLNRDVAQISDENNKLIINNKELKIHVSKLEKEQENASLKLQNSETELERVNSINSEMSVKIHELKLLTDQLKDKETEIEILHEDINAFHEEIASLKEQLKIVSRSPSPKKSGDEKKMDRQASNDKKQLTKIRKQITLLQHELDFNKKELNDKAFELAKAKLDVTELKNNLSQATKQTVDRDAANAELRDEIEQLQKEFEELTEEKQELNEQLQSVMAKLREEGNISELKYKLRQKTERCQELENELQDMKDLVERLEECTGRGRGADSTPRERALAVRSPTAELERAVRDQLNYSHALDEHIMDQILSASSDEPEQVPRLALNTSKSSSSIHSTSSDRMARLRVENEKLQMQVTNLESRIKDKDALITELNRVRDKLVQDWQTCKLRYEAERDNSGRLQLLLDTHKHSAEALQNQDSNMIGILKKRLESAMQSELELQQRDQQHRAQIADLERRLLVQGSSTPPSHREDLQREMDNNSRLKGEISLLKSKLEVERSRCGDLQALLEHSKLQAQRDLHERTEACNELRTQLAEIKRQKHESSVELVRAREQLNSQAQTLANLERKLVAAAAQRPINDALTEIESHKSDLSREIATLKKCLADTSSPELQMLRNERQQLSTKVEKLEAELQAKQTDEKDQAIRYLHCRCLRLESCRKALVWQKRYLQRVLDGYAQLERTLRLPSSRNDLPSRGKSRFKRVATVVVAVVRMSFLVRRRHQLRSYTPCLLRVPAHTHTPSQGHGTSSPSYTRAPPHTPAGAYTPRRGERPAAHAVAGVHTPRHSEPLARRLFKQDMRLNLPASPGLGDYMRRSPYNAGSPRDEPFILSSPRGELAAAYLNKLELVSQCLNQAVDASRNVP